MSEDQLAIIWLMMSSIGFLAIVFGIRYLRNRENMAMIEKGLDPRLNRNVHQPAPYKNLKWGLLLVGAGTGLALAYIITKYVLNDPENPALWFAFIAIGGGVGLIYSYKVEKKELLDKKE